MGWLQPIETREGVLETQGSGVVVSRLFGGGPTSSGKRVNADTARKYAAWFRAVSYSAGHISTLPLKLYGRRDDGGRTEQRDHPSFAMVHSQYNPEMSATAAREAQHGHLLTRGNAYAQIIRNGRNQAMRLWPLNPDKTELKRDNGVPFYVVRVKGETRRLPFDEVLHIPGLGFDGMRGWSVLKLARESIGLGLSAEEYSARFFGNNATPSGILTSPTEMSPEARKRLSEQWQKTHGGLSKQHRVAVLEGDIKWQSLGISAEDAQLLEARTFQIDDIARWFGLPPHKLMQLDNATFSNIESENISVLIDHIRPWAVRWEQALNNQVLTDNERKKGLFFKFNLDGLLRADAEKRAEKQRTEFNIGMATVNELRALEERNPLDNEFADVPFVRGEMIPLDQAGRLTPTERAIQRAVSEGDTEMLGRLVELRQTELSAPETNGKRAHRSTQSRRELVNTWQPIFERDFERLVRIETQDIRSELGLITSEGTEAFTEFLRDFYEDEITGKIERAGIVDLMHSYARAATRVAAEDLDDGEPMSRSELDEFMGSVDGSIAEPDGYIGKFVNRYASNARRDLVTTIRRAVEDRELRQTEEEVEAREAVEERLDEWVEGTDGARPRAEQKADWEANQIHNAVAKATFATAGIVELIWVSVGSSCPMCNALDGTVVGIRQPFVGEGEELVGTDGSTSIIPNVNVGHAPLHGGCWTPDHDIFTAEGWKPILEVDQGDRLWTMNPETRQMELDRVKGSWTKRWTDEVAHIETRTLDLRLTPDHKMAVVTDRNHKNGNDEPLERVEVQNLKYGAAIPRVPKWGGPNPDTIQVADRDWPAREAMEWIGWYLAEGTICEHGARGLWQVGIRQFDDSARARIETLTERLFDRVWKGRDTTYVPLREGDPMIDYLRDLGHSGDRYIPPELLQYGAETLRPLFDALIAGDGTECESSWSGHPEWNFRPQLGFSTSSERLADGVTELALKVGLRPTVGPRSKEPRTTTHANGTYTSKKVQQSVGFGRNRWSTFKHDQLTYEPYKGAVVGLSMEHNPVVFVRRGRKACWVGNCDCVVVPG